jgi:DNA-binding protein H-NS
VATYLELKEQAEKLLAEAERMREQEISDAIGRLRRQGRPLGAPTSTAGAATEVAATKR